MCATTRHRPGTVGSNSTYFPSSLVSVFQLSRTVNMEGGIIVNGYRDQLKILGDVEIQRRHFLEVRLCVTMVL